MTVSKRAIRRMILSFLLIRRRRRYQVPAGGSIVATLGTGDGVHLDTAAVEIQTPVLALAVPSQFGPATYRLGTADSTPAAVSRCDAGTAGILRQTTQGPSARV